MVIAIKMGVNGLIPTTKMLKGYGKTIPQAGIKGINDWGKYLSRNLKSYQRLSGKGATGGTRKGIRWNPLKKRRGSLSMPLSGIYLDRARPHWVPLKSSPKLIGWKRRVGYRASKLWFRPKHWIRPILKRSLTNLKPIVEQRVGEAIARRGR